MSLLLFWITWKDTHGIPGFTANKLEHLVLFFIPVGNRISENYNYKHILRVDDPDDPPPAELLEQFNQYDLALQNEGTGLNMFLIKITLLYSEFILFDKTAGNLLYNW